MLVEALCCLIAAWICAYGYFWRRSRFFLHRGIPGPQPTSVFSGSLKAVQKDRKVFNGAFLEWQKEHGKTFAFMEGGQKVICSSDLDLLYDVFVKHFDHFHSRKPIHPFPFNPDTDARVNVFTARGQRWRRLRTLTNPSFSPNKLRFMQTTMQDTTVALMRQLEQFAGTSVDLTKHFSEAATDVIERIAFGQEESGIGKAPNPVVQIIRKFFDPAPYNSSWVLNFYGTELIKSDCFPVSTFEFMNWTIYLHRILIKIKGSPLTALAARLMKTIGERRQLYAKAQQLDQPVESKDFVDLFLRAEATEEEVKAISDSTLAGIRSKVKIEKKLTDQEVISMCSVLMLAGVDTTATAMSCLAYHLAMHDTVQDKVYAEMEDFVKSEDDINYDNLNNLRYMDWCIKESMRVSPFAGGANSRICMKTCRVGKQNLLIEEGMTVCANIWAMHMDTENWGEDAAEFDPERWNPDGGRLPKNAFAFQPFGAGPRTCIGQRFALLEIKILFCHLLRKYRLAKNDHTKLSMAGIIVCGPSDVTVTLTPRGVNRNVGGQESLAITGSIKDRKASADSDQGYSSDRLVEQEEEEGEAF